MNNFQYETVYKAFDGTIFENENECANYCTRKHFENLSILGYIDTGKSLKSCSADKFDEIDVIHIPTDEAAQTYHKVGDLRNYAVPDQKGDWVWDDDDCEWYPLDKRIAYIQQLLDTYKGYKKRIREDLDKMAE